MKVLVIGSGGREHAIVDALSRSAQVSEILCAPGNAGIAQQARTFPVKDTDVEGLLKIALDEKVAVLRMGVNNIILQIVYRLNGVVARDHTKIGGVKIDGNAA